MTTRLPGQRAKAAPPQRNEGTWIALIFCIGIATGILALISLVLPDIFGVVLVLAAFGGFVALHYFTWGRWLMLKAAREADFSANGETSPRSPPVERVNSADSDPAGS